ncbi:MAG: hypothetical protein ABIG11_02950 [bacterium]
MKIKIGEILLFVLVVALLLLLALYLLRQHRSGKGADNRTDATYLVYKADREVLKVQNCPGSLMSRALLPPGQTPPRHPFVNAQSLDAFEEDELRKILLKSHDFTEFISLLEKNGYRVEKGEE